MSPSRPTRIASSLLVSAWIVFSGDGPLAGGVFLMQSKTDPRIVDITEEVVRTCTQLEEKMLNGGAAIQVLHAPGQEALASSALMMMERVQGLMTGRLGLRVKTGARLYLVELEEYPPSLKIIDKSPHVAVFALLAGDRPESSKLAVLEKTVYDALSHEWAHLALSDRYGSRSPGERARWIADAFASYVEYTAARELWPEGFDRVRARRLPLLNLASIDLKTLLRWRFERSLPPREPMDEFLGKYGAALGVFLRLEERGGSEAVLSFLDRLAGRGRLREAEVESALREIVGCDLATLARISPEQTQSMYEEAVAALKSRQFEKQSFGLSVIARFADRFGSHGETLMSLVADAEANLGIRERAAQLAVDQGPEGTAASLLRRIRISDGGNAPEKLEIPALLRLAKGSPACGVEGLARLVGSADASVANKALEMVREMAGKSLRPDQVSGWAKSKPFGTCDQEL